MKKYSVLLGALLSASLLILLSVNISNASEYSALEAIPADAVMMEKDFYYLGDRTNDLGETEEGYAHLLFDSEALDLENQVSEVSDDGCPGGLCGEPRACWDCVYFTCSTLKNPEPIYVDVSIRPKHMEYFLTLLEAEHRWESEIGRNILGPLEFSYHGCRNVKNNNQNEISFCKLDDRSLVAVAYTWHNPFRREITEHDIIFNNVDKNIVALGCYGNNMPSSREFDLCNVAMHEFGHSLGLDHPAPSCRQETMHSYITPGETQKRTLHHGDREGIRALY